MVKQTLLEDDYSLKEIERVINKAAQLRMINSIDGKYQLRDDREEIVRRYAILDTIARKGSALVDTNNGSYLLAPGYGPFYGIKLTELVEALCLDAPYFERTFQSSQFLNEDLEALKINGWIKFA